MFSEHVQRVALDSFRVNGVRVLVIATRSAREDAVTQQVRKLAVGGRWLTQAVSPISAAAWGSSAVTVRVQVKMVPTTTSPGSLAAERRRCRVR